MNGLACLSKHVSHRRLRPPVNLQVRHAFPDSAGDGQIPLDVAEADRGGDPQRAAAAAVGSPPSGLLRRPVRLPVHEVPDGVIHRDWAPHVRRVPATPYHEELGPRQLGDPPGPFGRDDLVVVAADHQDRARQGAAEPGRLGFIRDLTRGICVEQHSFRAGLHAPLHEIVVGLGGAAAQGGRPARGPAARRQAHRCDRVAGPAAADTDGHVPNGLVQRVHGDPIPARDRRPAQPGGQPGRSADLGNARRRRGRRASHAGRPPQHAWRHARRRRGVRCEPCRRRRHERRSDGRGRRCTRGAGTSDHHARRSTSETKTEPRRLQEP